MRCKILKLNPFKQNGVVVNKNNLLTIVWMKKRHQRADFLSSTLIDDLRGKKKKNKRIFNG